MSASVMSAMRSRNPWRAIARSVMPANEVPSNTSCLPWRWAKAPTMARRPAPPVRIAVPPISKSKTVRMGRYASITGAMTYLFETEQHAQLRASVRRFSQKHIAPHAQAWEESEEFPRDLYRGLAEAGLLGV